MIIFDLGGVLLQEAELHLSSVLPAHVDIERMHGQTPRMFNRMFDFIDLIFGKPCKKDYFLGNISGCEIVKKIKDSVDQDEYKTFFKSTQEKNLILYGSEFVLLPQKEASLTRLDLDGLEFVKKCKKSGIRIMILSNWQLQSFELIKNKFSELFNLFDPDDIIIPAHVGFIKPEAEVYNHIIEKLKLDGSKTFFVDDVAKNVTAAKECGIRGVVHCNWKQTENELLNNGLQIYGKK